MWFCECSAAKNGLQIAKRIFLVFTLAERVYIKNVLSANKNSICCFGNTYLLRDRYLKSLKTEREK